MGYVFSVCVSPDGKFIVSGSSDNSIQIWNFLECRKECTFTGHIGSVNSVCVSSDGKFIVSGSSDKSIKIWNLLGRRKECNFTRHKGSVCVSPDGKFIVSGFSDKSIKIWNTLERREEYSFIALMFSVNSIIFTTDSKLIIIPDHIYIKIWNTQIRSENIILTKTPYSLSSIEISVDGTFIIGKFANFSMKIWNTQTKKEQKLEQCHEILLKSSFPQSPATIIQYFITTDSRFAFKESNGIFDLIEINQIENSAKVINEMPRSYRRSNIEKQVYSEAFIADDFSRIFGPMLQMQIGICHFTMAHFACFTGNNAFLKKITEDQNFVLKTDAFGKSPLYYAIVKKRQDEIDFLLEKMANLFDLAQDTSFEQSVFAIRNDFSLLLNNSSRQLHLVVNKMMLVSKVAYAPLNEDFPIYRSGFSSTLKIEDFTQINSESEGIEEMPIVFNILLSNIVFEWNF